MARVDTLEHFLTDVADAIRTKTGGSSPIDADDFDTEIENIPSGGGDTPTEITTEADMDAIVPSSTTYGNKYNYTGTENKYINGLYRIDKELVDDGVILHNAAYCPLESNISSRDIEINCSIGSKLIVIATLRDSTHTLSAGWTELGVSNTIGSNQYVVVATKTAESVHEVLTVTQGSGKRMYINLFELPSVATITLDGFQYESSANKITATSQRGVKLYAISTEYYGSNKTPSCSDGNLTYYGETMAGYTPRQCCFGGSIETQSNVDFNVNTNTGIILATLTISNIVPSNNYLYYLQYADIDKMFTNTHTSQSQWGAFLRAIPRTTIYENGQTTSYNFSQMGSLKMVNLFRLAGTVTSSTGEFMYLSGMKYFDKFVVEGTLKTTNNMFGYNSGLVYVGYFDTSGVTDMSNMFVNCTSLNDDTLDNILLMCINSQETNKTLTRLGFNKNNYSQAKIESLPHYQDFVNAGWATGY